MAVGASRQPLLLRARDGPADSLVFLAAGLNATGTAHTHNLTSILSIRGGSQECTGQQHRTKEGL